MINVTKEPRDAHKKKNLKEETLQEITEKSMEKYLLDTDRQNFKHQS
jgi:hypothetical protein